MNICLYGAKLYCMGCWSVNKFMHLMFSCIFTRLNEHLYIFVKLVIHSYAFYFICSSYMCLLLIEFTSIILFLLFVFSCNADLNTHYNLRCACFCVCSCWRETCWQICMLSYRYVMHLLWDICRCTWRCLVSMQVRIDFQWCALLIEFTFAYMFILIEETHRDLDTVNNYMKTLISCIFSLRFPCLPSEAKVGRCRGLWTNRLALALHYVGAPGERHVSSGCSSPGWLIFWVDLTTIYRGLIINSMGIWMYLTKDGWLMVGWWLVPGFYYPVYWGLQSSKNGGIPINQPGFNGMIERWCPHCPICT